MAEATELIKEKIDVVEYIGRSVKLKKAGQNFKGVCPFHQEKTPSFTVSPQRQFWYCFGCQRGGDLFAFLMEQEHLDFPSALEVLGQEAGVDVRRQRGRSRDNARIYEVLDAANRFYQDYLRHPQRGRAPTAYLRDARQLEPAIITSFGLGYAPDSWDQTSRHLLGQGFTEKDLLAAGLIIRKPNQSAGGRFYDRFRNRVMFPLFDHLNRIVGFAGRTLSLDDQTAKYINSPETAVFKKDRLLYGLSVAKDAIVRLDYTIVVEGPLDVIAMHQVGITNTVAPQGTALTAAQLKLLRRFATRAMLVFDRDTAGQRATLKAIENGLREDLIIKVASLSTAKDPDEAARQNPTQLRQDLRGAVTHYQFLLQVARERFQDRGENFTAAAADFILPYIKLTTHQVQQEKLLRQLADDLDVSFDSLQVELAKLADAPVTADVPSRSPATPPQAERPTRMEVLGRELASLLLQYGDNLHLDGSNLGLARELVTDLDTTANSNPPLGRLIRKLLDLVVRHESVCPQQLDQDLGPEEKKLADLLILKDLGKIAENEQSLPYATHHLMREIYILRVKEKIHTADQSDARRELTQKLKTLQKNTHG